MKIDVVAGCVLLLATTACVPGGSSNSSASADQMVSDTEREANKLEVGPDHIANDAVASVPAGAASSWTYATSEDKMRGTSGRTLRSVRPTRSASDFPMAKPSRN